MARASTGRSRGVGSRIGWPLKIFVGVLLILLVLLILNAFALNNETKSASINVEGARLVNTTAGKLQVLDTGDPVRNGVIKAPDYAKRGLKPGNFPRSVLAWQRLMSFSGTPLVLIHGSAGAINWWDDLIPLLKPYHRVIAIDLLGYGGSDKPDSDYSIETQGNLVAQVLDKLDVNRGVLVGHSLGGSVVTSVAEQAPDLVSGLVLIDSGPDTSYGGLSGAAKASRTPILGQALWRLAPDSMVRKNLSQAFAPGYDVPDKYVQDVRNMTYPAYSKSSKEIEKYIDSTSLPDRLTEVDKPLLVIFGEEDQIYDARESLSAYAAVPGVMTHMIPGSGHSPQVEVPTQTAREINYFTWVIARTRAIQRAGKSAAANARKRVAEAKKKAGQKASKRANQKLNQAKKNAGKKATQAKQKANQKARQAKQQANQGKQALKQALDAQKEAARSKVESP
ncbi:MAG: alpha/beta fold hydrolase [Solirubrobacterales bacterium]|nr:alpha/beta fold hydrolase [Solirubrobacterales bacterium]